MEAFDVIIVGGGLAGASLAVALRDARLKIALVEGHPPRRPEGWDARIYAVSPASVGFLTGIGAWKHLDGERLTPVRAMEVRGDAGGRLDFSAYETGVDELAWIVESSLLACEFWETLKRQGNVRLFCPDRPSALAFSCDSARLELEGGETLQGKLIVAADGRDSWVREQARLAASHQPYGEQGVVANFSCQRPHHYIARQWFRRDGVLAWLPLPGQRISMVWSTPDTHAHELCALAPDELAERVAAAGGRALGMLEVITPAAAFPLRLMRVPEIVAPRLALVGDAAHGIHPLSGHGINLGFSDAAELAQLLKTAPAWQDPGEFRFLQRYQRARREEILLLQTGTHALQRLFHSQLPLAGPLRNIGLQFTHALPIVKSALVRYALGSL